MTGRLIDRAIPAGLNELLVVHGVGTGRLRAYLLERLAADPAADLSTVASVASFFISRVDSEVDRRLEAIGTDEALAFLHQRAMARPDPATLIHVPIMGRATAAVDAQESAFGDRSAAFMVSIDGQTYDPAKFDQVRAWVRDTIDAARALPGASGAYLSFSADQGTDQHVVDQQYGDNLPRLQAIKQRYDPTNLFRLNANINPA